MISDISRSLEAISNGHPDDARQDIESASGILLKAIERAGYTPGEEIVLAVSSVSDHRYLPEPRSIAPEEFVTYWGTLIDRYPIVSLEGAIGNWDSWALLTRELGSRVQIINTPSGIECFFQILEHGVGNTILVNTAGTLSEILDLTAAAHRHGYAAILPFTAGDGEDYADIAVAARCGQIRTATPSLAQYNQLIRIEEALGKAGRYAGRSIRHYHRRTLS